MTLAEDARRLMEALHGARDAYLGEGFALPLDSEAVRQMGITLFLEGRRTRESGHSPTGSAPSVGPSGVSTASGPAAPSPLDVEKLRAAVAGKLAAYQTPSLFAALVAAAKRHGIKGRLKDGIATADASALVEFASLLGVPLP